MSFQNALCIFAFFISFLLVGCQSGEGDELKYNVGQDSTKEINRDIETNTKQVTVVMGATKGEVDSILEGWESREDKLSTTTIKVFRYTQDVTLIVGFRGGNAIGVAVIDRPGAGVMGITESRMRELVQLIGQEPTQRNIKRDAKGIREFYVGDTENW